MSNQTGYSDKANFIEDVNSIKQSAHHYNNTLKRNIHTKSKNTSAKIAKACNELEKKLSNDLSNAENNFSSAIDETGKIQPGKDQQHDESLRDITEVEGNDAGNLKKLADNSNFYNSDALNNIADNLEDKAKVTHERMKQLSDEDDGYSYDRNGVPVIDWETKQVAFKNAEDPNGYSWRTLENDDIDYYQQKGGKVPKSYDNSVIAGALKGLL